MQTVRLMLCVNYYRNGTFINQCRGISLWDSNKMTLEPTGRVLKCDITGDHLRLGKSRTWRIYGHSPWVGNWCWDAVSVSAEDAAEIINFAMAKGFVCTCASGPFIDVMEGKRKLEADDFAVGVNG